MVERKEAGDRRFEAAIARGIQPDRELSRDISDQITTDANAKLRAAFGESMFESIQYFENTISMRNIADQLAKALYYSDTPLAPAQAEALIDVIAANARTPQGKYNLDAVNSEAMVAQARGVLSTPQLAKLRDLESQRLEQRKLRVQFDAGNSPTTPKPPGT